MTDPKSLAQLIGPTLIAVTLSEALNLHIWSANLAPLTYLNGCLLFVAGLSVVRVHNRWVRAWPVAVTVVAWGSVLGGLARMFAPQAQQGGENIATYAVLATLFLTGVFLTFKGYSRSASG